LKKRRLEIILERLEGFSQPSAVLEQYSTPAPVAAELLHLAFMNGELDRVTDLGCGTGILAIGAALLGARAMGVEIDSQAIRVATKNAALLEVDVDFVRADVRSVALRKVNTVVMNPPFGAQAASRGDRDFLKKATSIADTVYSIHNLGSEQFIRRFVSPCTVEEVRRIAFPLKRSLPFHTLDRKIIEVELYRISCK
jgi:putative methylase